MIIELQRRLREVGRIRIGEQVPTQKGGTRPSKLNTFRLTSRDDQVLVAASAMWGGEVRPWDAPDGPQFELYTTVNAIAVVIPPTEMAFSQWYEQWTAGGCRNRCDGQWDQVNDKACSCDPEDRACKIHTRLSVMLPELPGLGVWRLETHGYYAAVELNGAVEVCQGFAGAGQMLPARLRLEQRAVKRLDNQGKTQTMRFGVPVLDVDVQIGQLMAGPTAAGAIGPGGPAEVPAFTPVAELAAPSVAEQMKAIDTAPQPPARANSRAPLPSTGLAPRPAGAETQPVQPAAPRSGPPPCPLCGGSLADQELARAPGGGFQHKVCPTTGDADVPPVAAPVEPLPLEDPLDDWDRQKRRFHAVAGKRWPGPAADREKARKAWLTEHYQVDSLKDLGARQLAAAADKLDEEVGEAPAERPAPPADLVAPPAPPPPDDPFAVGTEHDWDRRTWDDYLAKMGVRASELKFDVKRLADALGVESPKRLEDVKGNPELASQVRACLDEISASREGAGDA